MGLIVSLIIIGLLLLLAEILIIPGVGVAGILGLLSIAGSCYYAFYEFGNLTGAIVTGINALILLLSMVYVLRAQTWKKISLNTNIDSKAVSDESCAVSVGDRGKTMTRLAPSGSVRFGNIIVEAKAVDGILDPETEVEVVMIDDNKIYVGVPADKE